MTATLEAERGRGDLGTLAGTGNLLRFYLRRTRVYLAGWLGGMFAFSALMTASILGIYADRATRAETAVLLDTPAMRFMTGPSEYIDAYAGSIGALFVHNMLMWSLAVTGVMFILLVTRLTRADEETSRSEVVRSEPVGRRADLAAALLVALIAAAALGLAITLSVLWLEEDAFGEALLYGLTFTATGIAFAAITAVCAQLASYAATTNGLAFAVLGYAFMAAGSGYAQENQVAWLSPIGWGELTYVYTPDERWWPLAVPVVFAAALTWLAFTLAARRDFGAGMLPNRPGRAEAEPGLRSASALTFRLTKGMFWAAVVTMLSLGTMYGLVMGGADELLETLPETSREAITRGGETNAVDGFTISSSQVQAYIALVFALLVIGRARKEETAGRGELLAAAPVTRSVWPGSYFASAMVNGTVGVLVGGAALAALGAATLGDGDAFGRLLLAAVNYLPAVWLMTAVGFALLGWLPRAGALRWLLWLYVFVVGYLRSIIEGLPEWAKELSPFAHVAEYPTEDFAWTPLVVLTAVTAAAAALGFWGVRRRDLHFS